MSPAHEQDRLPTNSCVGIAMQSQHSHVKSDLEKSMDLQKLCRHMSSYATAAAKINGALRVYAPFSDTTLTLAVSPTAHISLAMRSNKPPLPSIAATSPASRSAALDTLPALSSAPRPRHAL